jgi:flagellar biosynthesis protein FlhG
MEMLDHLSAQVHSGEAVLTSRQQGACRVVSFTSGKGGVGKSTFVINAATALADQGRRVLVFDADFALANIDVLLGLPVEKTLEDVMSGRSQIRDVLIETHNGFDLLPGANGTEWMATLSWEQRTFLLTELESLAVNYDYILIDTPAGLGPEVLFFNSGAHEIVVIVNHEPTSMTDAYGLLKVLSRRYQEREFSVLINRAKSERHAMSTFRRFAEVVEQYLHSSVNFRGWIPEDRALSAAVEQQKAFVTEFPSSPAARQCRKFAERIDQDFHALKVKGGLQLFFRQLMTGSE